MSKVIKLKQEDLEKLVQDVIKEQEEWKGSTDAEIMQMGQQGPEELGDEPEGTDSDEDGVPLRLGKDDKGNYYVFQDDDSETPKIFKINK
tara:strand:- start:11797 stop:12066 length:270 start_codon:yes stop_codon:yes gene_type:complete